MNVFSSCNYDTLKVSTSSKNFGKMTKNWKKLHTIAFSFWSFLVIFAKCSKHDETFTTLFSSCNYDNLKVFSSCNYDTLKVSSSSEHFGKMTKNWKKLHTIAFSFWSFLVIFTKCFEHEENYRTTFYSCNYDILKVFLVVIMIPWKFHQVLSTLEKWPKIEKNWIL